MINSVHTRKRDPFLFRSTNPNTDITVTTLTKDSILYFQFRHSATFTNLDNSFYYDHATSDGPRLTIIAETDTSGNARAYSHVIPSGTVIKADYSSVNCFITVVELG